MRVVRYNGRNIQGEHMFNLLRAATLRGAR
jgi:hypothetical protein